MQEERISGFSCVGHAGLGEEGSDILCAAITSALRLTECTVNDICGAHAQVKIDPDTASITLTLPAQCQEEDAIQAALCGFMTYLIGLREEYPDNLDVLEV